MEDQTRADPPPSVLRRGVLLTGSGALISIFFLFLETIIAVRALTTSSYGIYVLLIAVTNFLVVLVDSGCTTATTQMIASSEEGRQAALVGSAVVFRVLTISVAAAIVWLSQDVIRSLDSSPGVVLYLVYVPLMMGLASLDELGTGILQGFRRYRHMAVAQAVRSTLRLGLTVLLLVVFQFGLIGLIYSWIVSFVVSVAYQYLSIPVIRRLSFQRRLIRDILRFGMPIQMTRFLWLVFRRVDVLLLGTLAGSASAAYYEVAARIPDALQRLSESFTSVYFPAMANLLATGKRAQAIWTLNHSLRLLSFLAACSALGAVLFSQQIITLLFSARYAASAPAFAVLMVAFHMSFIVNVIGYTLTSAGYPSRSLAKNLVRSTINVVGDIILIPLYGVIGPAFATLVAVYVTNPLGVWLLRRSDVALATGAYVKQTVLLLICTGAYIAFQPAGLVYKLAILAAFVMLNVLFATVSLRDMHLVHPRFFANQPVLPKESMPHGP